MEESESSADESEAEESDDDAAPSTPATLELKPRRDGRGRFQAESVDITALRIAQLMRGVAPSTTTQNLQDAFSLLLPGARVPGVTGVTARQLRTVGTLASQTMAAYKFASALRILSFGWDESTKFGDGVFSCNAQVKYADGTVEDICLRGLSILPEGGTSKAVLAHIEERIFAHSRRLLTAWKEDYEKEHEAGSWAGGGHPSPDRIGIHRLAEDTVLCTDTCNGARCTRRLLAEAVMDRVKEDVGLAKWEAMSEEQRDRKYKTYRGDCWQHLRNIIIDAMAAKADEVLRAEIQDDLDLCGHFNRIEPDGGSMIHASFKHLHHKGEYCHGRGREYKAYRGKHAPSALLPPLERSCGNRCASPASKHSRPWILILPQIACSFHVASSFVPRRFR